MTVALSVRNLVKNFGQQTALAGISLDVEAGELIALLGPSGCGKTTMLRAIAGLEAAEQGQVLFGDIDASNLSLRERRIGFVFQHYALFRHMTVMNNIAFGLAQGLAGCAPQKRLSRPGCRSCFHWSSLMASRSVFPPSSRVVSASASPWRAPLPSNPVYCCSMSHSAPLMPR